MKRFTAGIAATLLFGVTTTNAHLKLNSLSLKEPATFTSGDSVELTWKMDHPHSYGHYIYFRLTGNDEWECIDSVKGVSSGVDYKYTWRVPETATDEGQLLVFLPEFRTTPAPQEHYTTLYSGKFTISVPAEPTTAVVHSSFPVTDGQGKKSSIKVNGGVTLNGRVVAAEQLRNLDNKIVPHCIILQKGR